MLNVRLAGDHLFEKWLESSLFQKFALPRAFM